MEFPGVIPRRSPAPGTGISLLLSEFLCCGHWPESDWPASLLREGRAMLECVVQDLLALPDIRLLMTWDERLPVPEPLRQERVIMTPVRSTTEAATEMLRLASVVDSALVIAPELNRLLEQQCRLLGESGLRLLNCTPDAIRHCADKWAVFQTCTEHGIPTIPTCLPGERPHWLPSVVKRRDGAGSLEMRCWETVEEWTRWRKNVSSGEFIEQPYVEGQTGSLAVIFHDGSPRWFLPPAQQLLTRDGQFQYQGGVVPASQCEDGPMRHSITTFAQAVPGLHGYVGFDFVLPDGGGSPLLVDVNPRICTSYIGYRAICRNNLVAWLVDPGRMSGPEFSGRVSFTAAGEVGEFSSLENGHSESGKKV